MFILQLILVASPNKPLVAPNPRFLPPLQHLSALLAQDLLCLWLLWLSQMAMSGSPGAPLAHGDMAPDFSERGAPGTSFWVGDAGDVK